MSGTSAQSLKLDPSTTIVKLFATQDCWIQFGVDPTAVASGAGAAKSNNILLRGGFAAYFGVPKNSSYKVAAVQDSASGKLDLLEGA